MFLVSGCSLIVSRFWLFIKKHSNCIMNLQRETSDNKRETRNELNIKKVKNSRLCFPISGTY